MFTCSFQKADFYWAEAKGLAAFNSFKDTRISEETRIIYGPKGVEIPMVQPIPLYRPATSEIERRRLLECAFAGSNPISG